MELKKRVAGKCEVLIGEQGLIDAAANLDYDIFVGAMVGFCGLAPTLEAIKRGKIIALATRKHLLLPGSWLPAFVASIMQNLFP